MYIDTKKRSPIIVHGLICTDCKSVGNIWQLEKLRVKSSISKPRQNSKNYGGAAVYEYKKQTYRNALLSIKQTLKKTAFGTNGSPKHLYIVSYFCFLIYFIAQ